MILIYLGSSMAEVSLHYWLFFFNFGHLQVEKGDQSWTKGATFGSFPFKWKLESFKKIFKQCFCFLEDYLSWELRQYWIIFEEVRAQKLLRKGHFVDAESVSKIFKIFNLSIANPILIELTRTMHLHKSVNRKALRARN